jgi:hypothetical protein
MDNRFYIGDRQYWDEHYEVLSNHNEEWVEIFNTLEEAEEFCAESNREFADMATVVARLQAHLDLAISDLDWLENESGILVPGVDSLKANLSLFRENTEAF